MYMDYSLLGTDLSLPRKALETLKNDQKAAGLLNQMEVRISIFTGTLNIYNSTFDDLKYFAKLLNNDEYTYDSVFKLTSFYY